MHWFVDEQLTVNIFEQLTVNILSFVKPANDEILEEMDNKDAGIPQHFFKVPTFLTVSGQLHLEAVSG
jgi:hypothetical protein